MDRGYIKSEEESTRLGLWVIFFNALVCFIFLLYKTYILFVEELTYRWELSFNIVGLPMGLVLVFLLLCGTIKSLIKITSKK